MAGAGINTRLDFFCTRPYCPGMDIHVLGYKNSSDIVFALADGKAWPVRFWQMLCLSGETSLLPTRRAEGPAIISCSRGRCEADDFKLTSSDFRAAGAALEWSAAKADLRLQSAWNYDAQNSVLSRRDRLVNSGNDPVTIFRCLPRFAFPPGNYELYFQQSRWAHENQGEWQKLRAGSITLDAEWGRSTEGATPYFCLREQEGHAGLAFHVVPRGNWVIRIAARIFNNMLPAAVVDAGLSDEDLRLTLGPGEGIDLPEILLQPLPDGEPEKAAPALHRHLNKTIPLPGFREAPLSYNTWLDRFSNLNPEHLRKQLKAAAELGCEIFIIDAGWFGDDEGWGKTGDWREKTKAAFCGKMREFAEEVRASGLGFGLWMEPERYADGIPVRAKHPEWFVPGTTRIRMENKEARAYVGSEISRLIETYKAAWVKFDHNASLGYDGSGAELYHYYSAWYGLLDELRRKHPSTVFENCSSGAMRHDIGLLRHYDLHFISDTAGVMDVLRIGQGDLLRMPPGRILRWITPRGIEQPVMLKRPPERKHVLSPAGATWSIAETVDPDFLVISAMFGAMAFSGDLQSLSQPVRNRMKWFIDFYKQRRRFIIDAACHLLTPVRPMNDRAGWTILQMQAPETTESLVFHFYMPDDGQERRLVRLRALIPEKNYRVRRVGPESSAEQVLPGKQLMETGLELHEAYDQNTEFKAGIIAVEPQ